MHFIKRILQRIAHPGGAFLACFYILFELMLTGCILLLVLLPAQTPLHCAVYALTAVGLGYFVYTLVLLAPKLKARALHLLQRHPFSDNVLKNYGFRTMVFAAIGFAVNVAYAALQAAVGIAAHSAWNVAIALFYAVLLLLKGALLLCANRLRSDRGKEIRAYHVCGCLLWLLIPALVGILLLINRTDAASEYAGYFIYAVAAYTFYKIVSAVVQFVKARRQDDLLVRAVRNVNLVGAAYSVLVLQVSMMQAFGDGQGHTLTNVLGGAVALLIFAVGAAMAARTKKEDA